MSEIRVPELGESIVEATILSWFKQPGDAVAAGDAVAELETDKVNVEVIAEDGGTLQSVSAQPGDTVKVGEAIGIIGAVAGAAAPAAPIPAPSPAPAVAGGTAPSTARATTAPTATSSQDALLARATPAIRRLAHERGVDLAQVTGTGGMGRITESDVFAHVARGGAGTAPQAPHSAVPTAAGTVASGTPQPAANTSSAQGDRPDEERQKMSRRRLTIARRLVEVQQTAAMLTTFNEVDMTNVMDVRKRRKSAFSEKHGVSLGFMSFFTKATVAALKQFPLLNAEIRGEEMVVKHHYDIGIAVAAEGGLVVPVVRDADRRNFAEIEREIGRMAEKARSNTLGLGDLQGGTFTITNGGVFGSLFSTPILNAPQVGILGMHGIQQRPIAVDGTIEIRPMMYLALSYDHRIVDGAEAVQFLVAIKRMIEDPESLLLEG